MSPRGDVVIRPCYATDVEQFRELRLLALRDEPDAYGSTYEESSRRPTTAWIEMAKTGNCFLAFDGDRAVGMASGGEFSPYPHARWLYGMFVHADYRGTGVARDLVHEVAEWTRGLSVMTLGLHVTTTVSRAVAFYRGLGFVPSGPAEPMQRDPTLHLQTMTTHLLSNDRI